MTSIVDIKVKIRIKNPLTIFINHMMASQKIQRKINDFVYAAFRLKASTALVKTIVPIA